jgi:diguanylate cyclase (GGDEF)-like protein
VLDEVELTDADASLGPDEGMELAASMVHDEEYYRQKDIIRDGMSESLATLEETALKVDQEALNAMNLNTVLLRAVIVFQTVGIFALVYLISRLGINPILAAVKHIRQDGPIPEDGASEFRYLARAYNKMYEAFQSSLEHMSFKASHDELTGAYNRAGYDLLLSSMDLENTYMVLFDVDNFKQVNDSFGHEVGDEVLQKVVRVLKNHFRADDYVCRIGGDEFVVFMAHTSELQHDLLVFKVNHINADLSDTSKDGLPSISVSVGIAHGSGASSAQDLFERTDAAMYQAKQRGKNTYMFDESAPATKA